jgi:hypothetical protein
MIIIVNLKQSIKIRLIYRIVFILLWLFYLNHQRDSYGLNLTFLEILAKFEFELFILFVISTFAFIYTYLLSFLTLRNVPKKTFNNLVFDIP